MNDILMPQVGQDLPTARLVEWTRRIGDRVEPGDVVAVVESEKATFDVVCDAPGILLEILVEEGEEGAVLQPIARVGEPAELAALVAFLASEKASYITAQSIAVDGGWIKSLL